MNALIGRKLGMTQVYNDQGTQIPVTVLEVGPCTVVQKKTAERDGYDAIQLGYIDQKEQRLSRSVAGHFRKNGVTAKRILREVRSQAGDKEISVGDIVTASIFEGVTHVDVTGVSKGRGFQGVVKRHGMSGGRASHGSGMHREVGSIGMCVSPARVIKNKKMPGQMGNVQVTAQNLEVVDVREKDNAVLVCGSVPGPTGGIVLIKKSIKKPAKAS